jgi:tRNA pseudouridine32 synthase/23S rRNA pseudouridine746 synthase/23S rRNA pseudouridine1911/1915/1917 synthase
MQDISKPTIRNNKKKRSVNRHLPQGLAILYEDKDILVANKPAGMLSVASETNKTRTAYWFLTDYVRKGAFKSRNRLFIVHRLDQWTSGVLLFAKSEEMKFRLQANWKDTKKTYAAIIHGQLAKKEGVITSYLAENTEYVVYSTTDTAKGKLAHTAYKVLKENQRYSLLEIDLLTGRKNQIRVHFADAGHPIVGDCKYGKKNDGHQRLALHAKSISFKHPAGGKQMTFEADVPTYFAKLMPDLKI